MPILTQLTIYPVKSCAGIDVQEALLTAAGLSTGQVADRQWMVVDAHGQFLSQREHPRMALIVPQLAAAGVLLSAPGRPPLVLPYVHTGATGTARVTLWDDSFEADDGGDAAAAWFSTFLGVACRLVRFGAAVTRLSGHRWTGGAGAPARFADGYPVLLIGAASLDDINARLAAAGRPALPMNRFRPNLVVDGLASFEEDYVERFTIGEAAIDPVKPCPRCPIPSVDQATGERGPDPLDVLQAYRRKAVLDDAVCVGMNCIVAAGAGVRLSVGQAVETQLAFD